MSNTPPEIAADNCNNCPITINYVNKYCIANSKFRFVSKLIKKTKKKYVHINKFIYLKTAKYKINL
jgi:hypothetical protein